MDGDPDTETPPLAMRRRGFDPDPELTALRDSGEIHSVDIRLGDRAWLVTNHADGRAVLSDPARFSNGRLPFTRIVGMPGVDEERLAVMRAGNLLAFDPPEHARLRGMLAPAFGNRAMLRLRPRVREIVEDHLDALERGGPPADLVTDFALPIPSLVICDLLGVPPAGRARFQRLSQGILDLSGGHGQRILAHVKMRSYLADLVASTRADPGEGLFGTLVREHGDDLTDDELVGIGVMLLLGGHETTSNMLALGTYALLRHPDQLALLRAEPERIDGAVEELLRWLSVAPTASLKITTTEVELGGRRIGPGELVLVALSAANRDPALAPDPDTLDLTRPTTGHLAFGHGVHYCVGAHLARMQLRTALPALIARFPALRACGPTPGFRTMSVMFGLSSLHVTW